MIKKISRFIGQRGFSLLELVVAIGIISFICILLASFIVETKYANSTSKADGQVVENARRALDQITYEIKNAKSIYAPTTNANQLSLETLRYLPTDETNSFIDFFLCGTSVCMKKESQTPIAITADTVNVTSLIFSYSQATNIQTPSVKISMTVSYKNPNSSTGDASSITLTSTASLRNY